MKIMDTVTPPSGARFTGKIVSFVDFWLGQQLREIRREQSLSLEQVARKADISIGSLSQIERGMTSPTVNMLHRISGALNISLGELLSNTECTDEQTDGWIAKAASHKQVVMKDKKIIKKIITPSRCRSVDLYQAIIQPGGSSGDEWITTRSGEISGLVIYGQLQLWFDKRYVKLEQNDTFCYTSDMPRKWNNPTDQDTCVLWVITKPERE
jgi:transcriptional regulator with XRE-family HTH domain